MKQLVCNLEEGLGELFKKSTTTPHEREEEETEGANTATKVKIDTQIEARKARGFQVGADDAIGKGYKLFLKKQEGAWEAYTKLHKTEKKRRRTEWAEREY
eukprot:5231245-Pyramimonas_sp.AAC.1